MSNFDPDLSQATLDFQDGATTVDSNFLNAITVQFGSIASAGKALVADGDIGLVTLDYVLPTEPYVEVDLGGTTADVYILETDGVFLYVAVEDGNTVEIRTAGGISTGRSIVSGAAPIKQLMTDGAHLVIVGATNVEIWDLSDDSFVASISPVLPARFFLHGGRVYHGAGTSLSAYLVATGVLDATFGTAGVATVTTTNRLAVDDFGILLNDAADGFQYLTLDGVSAWNVTVTGEIATFYLAMFNDSELIAVGDSNVSAISRQTGALTAQQTHGQVMTIPGRAGFVRGWLAFATGGGELLLFDINSFRKSLVLDAGDYHINHICTDGVDLITSANDALTPPSGTPINGFRRWRPPQQRSFLVQKIEPSSYGRPPYNNLIVRPQ